MQEEIKEKYDLPEEIANMFDKAQVLEYLRDKYVKVWWGFKKAKKCAFEASELKRKAWQEIYTLYPELKTFRETTKVQSLQVDWNLNEIRCIKNNET